MRIKDNVKSVYTQIIVLCEIFHISFLFIFKHFSMQIPFMYNIGSVIFYILMLFVVLKGYYRVCIVLVHLEVSAFVTVTVLNGGYSSDFALYLLSMATFVYFNPFKHRSVTYIFSICEVLLYIGLTLHCRHIYSEAEVNIVFVTIYNTVLLHYAYRDRRNKKRTFRALWIQRINAAARLDGMSYSQLMGALHKAGIEINRKVLADLAVNNPEAFKAIVAKVK